MFIHSPNKEILFIKWLGFFVSRVLRPAVKYMFRVDHDTIEHTIVSFTLQFR